MSWEAMEEGFEEIVQDLSGNSKYLHWKNTWKNTQNNGSIWCMYVYKISASAL